MNFEIKENQFYKDGTPIKIFSGAVHYFRNMPDTWRDIFKKMKAAGLNCVETYCAWNLHEPQPDVFNFENNLDIARFVKIAQEEDLMVIVRPGPYICAEWEFGGLPWWIQADESMEIRCMNKNYIKRFDIYLDKIFEQIRPLLFTNGGPIIMLQCENEYGYYGDDKEYLEYLRDGYIRRGMDVPLFTSDGSVNDSLSDGTIDGCLPTLNFGSRVAENFAEHDEKFPNVPKVCMEMWNGWFDTWGEEHHTTSFEDYSVTITDMIDKGSFNMYMFIGGTNFGFMNGAVYGFMEGDKNFGKYLPTVTSYDYDALLTECGDVTPKYMKVRKLLGDYLNQDLPPVPENRKKMAYGQISLNQSGSLFANLYNLSNPIHSDVPKCMEHYGIGYGYILYKSVLKRDYNDVELFFEELGDRAHVFVNDKLQGIVYTNDERLGVKISAKQGDTLFILVENMGRANFGTRMMSKKGISERLLLGTKIHFSWDVYPLEMNNLECLEYDNVATDGPCFYKGYFNASEANDTFIKLDKFRKGIVIINGFNLGRYWEIGPQKTLYIPASLIKSGENEVVVFETDGLKGEPVVEFLDAPDLG